MIMIPSSIVYFILGFVSCLALIIVWVIISINKENKNRKEIIDKLTTNFVNSLKEKDDDDEEE